MLKRSRTLFAILPGVVFLLCSPACCQRILVVTTESLVPSGHTGPMYNGEYVITDLVAAGLPFDVVTYGRFVNMSDLGDHDIVFLSGSTTPTLVSQVAAKCQSVLQGGRKVFINGHWPYERLDANSNVVEFNEYSLSLFNVNSTGLKSLAGVPVVPASIQKDISVTSIAQGVTSRTYTFNTPPAMTVTIAGKAVGFLYPQGGVIDSYSDYTLALLDYGKVACYLRYGSPVTIGFANDRIGGKPIASFEVHCDRTSNLPAISAINGLSSDLAIPLVNLLVYSFLNSSSISAWNALTSPYMTIGSHTRTHQWDWTMFTMSNFLSETVNALTDQRALIPATGNYFNFSGKMNPTTEQIDVLYSSGVVFGAGGGDRRTIRLTSGQYLTIQRMPVRQDTFHNLALSTSTPFCLSQTANDDQESWGYKTDYEQDLLTSFEQNVKYGMYTFGQFHDFSMDPNSQRYVNGTHMSQHIRNGMQYLLDRNAKFIATEQLISRLRDFIAGQITCTWNPDGSASITVTRPNSLVNEVKIGFKDGATPFAAGASIMSQRLAGDCLYVSLSPETTSTIQVHWENLPPPPPGIEISTSYISNETQVSFVEVNPGGVQEYRYAVGTTAGGTDAQDWTSTGATPNAVLSQARFQPGRTYYVSAKARYTVSDWSLIGTSPPLVADSTPPPAPVVTDDGLTQLSNTHIHAVCVANDPESGIASYQYAVGTSPGASGTVAWTQSSVGEVDVQVSLQSGLVYFISFRARNGAGAWSTISSSDGIAIEPLVVGRAKYYPDGTTTRLAVSNITAKFPGEFYVESLDSSSGFKVLGAISYDVTDNVSVYGTIQHTSGEPVMEDAAVTFLGRNVAQEPNFMTNSAIGGAGDSAIGGPAGGIGLNNVCMLVSTSGVISAKSTDYIYVNDGSIPNDGIHPRGVKVLVSPTNSFQTGMHVIVTGISSLEPDGSNYRRRIRARGVSDVSIKAQTAFP